MNSKITIAIIAALLSGATLAADPLPSARFSELNWLPASPAQLQVLGLGNLKWAEHARFMPVPGSCWVDTYNGLPVSRHQREVLGSQHKLVTVATPDTYKGLPVSRHQREVLGCERSETWVTEKSGDMDNSLITIPAPPLGLFC